MQGTFQLHKEIFQSALHHFSNLNFGMDLGIKNHISLI
jgi:hypothetical protein